MGSAGPNPANPAEYVHEKRALVRRTGDGVLVLAADASPPLLLRGTALAIWDAFESPRSVDDVAKALAVSYGAPAERVRAEIETLVDMLHCRGMLASRWERRAP
jgi:hypothetical protein